MNFLSKGPIDDKEMALDVAYAQKPYIDKAQAARAAGNLGALLQHVTRGEHAARTEELIAINDGSWREKLMKEQAFSELCDQEADPFLTLEDFRLANREHGAMAWTQLAIILNGRSDIPLRFLQYYPGEWVVIGNLEEAAKIIGSETRIGKILEEFLPDFEAATAARPIEDTRDIMEV